MSENGRKHFSIFRLPAIWRSAEWWEFKGGPVLALAYGTVLQSGASVFELWPALVGIVVALACVGVWANVLNDWTDIDEDLTSGKANRMAGRPDGVPLSIVAAAGTVGWSAVLLLQPGPSAIALYTANCLIFIAYSVPPTRLKARGGLGVIADAMGAHVLPALFAIVCVTTATRGTLDPVWLIVATIWSFACGLRGILWHQLSDYSNDLRAGASTFVCRVGPATARRLGEWLVFPLEIIALAGLLWQCASPLPVFALGADILLVWLRREHYLTIPMVVAFRGNSNFILHEFNDTLLPISLLIALAVCHPQDMAILFAHYLLFPARTNYWVRDLAKLSYQQARNTWHQLRSGS